MTSKSLLSLLAALVTGVVFGYLLQGWMRHQTLTFNDQPTIADEPAAKPASEFTADERKGWCCPTGGADCYEEADDRTCLSKGGASFAYTQEMCQRICKLLTP